MAQLKDMLSSWVDTVESPDKIKEIIKREQGRIAFYVHTGGGYLGSFEKGEYFPAYRDSEKYLANIREALSQEKGVVLLLGAHYEGINEIQTQARVIDLPSVREFPAPNIDYEIDTYRLNPFAPIDEVMDEMHKSWKPVHKFLKSVGVMNISPFGGEVAPIDEEGRVTGMCVNGARIMLNKEFDITVYPQLCGNENGNLHITGQDLSKGKYTSKAGTE